MKTGEIIISDNGKVTIRPADGQVWLSKCQLASLFDVYVSAIDANVRSILKSGVVQVNISHGATVMGNTVLPDWYDLEMITALAFRLNSDKARFFREWVMKRGCLTSLDGPFCIKKQGFSTDYQKKSLCYVEMI